MRFTLYLWKLLPALRIGLSKRPPPETMPTTPRHVDGIVLRVPEGKRMRVFLPSSECPTIMQEQPPARAKRPRSLAFSSTIAPLHRNTQTVLCATPQQQAKVPYSVCND